MLAEAVDVTISPAVRAKVANKIERITLRTRLTPNLPVYLKATAIFQGFAG
jgi:hypothetical protein